jgi:hypothetical protein
LRPQMRAQPDDISVAFYYLAAARDLLDNRQLKLDGKTAGAVSWAHGVLDDADSKSTFSAAGVKYDDFYQIVSTLDENDNIVFEKVVNELNDAARNMRGDARPEIQGRACKIVASFDEGLIRDIQRESLAPVGRYVAVEEDKKDQFPKSYILMQGLRLAADCAGRAWERGEKDAAAIRKIEYELENIYDDSETLTVASNKLRSALWKAERGHALCTIKQLNRYVPVSETQFAEALHGRCP